MGSSAPTVLAEARGVNKRVALVLGLTFCALVAATVVPPCLSRVPTVTHTQSPTVHWRWVSQVDLSYSSDPSPPGQRDNIKWYELHHLVLAIEYGVILALGGLLALFFRTRAARAA